MAINNCSSCKASLVNDFGSIRFKCPKCGKSNLARCSHCRKIAATYTCHECGFAGPN